MRGLNKFYTFICIYNNYTYICSVKNNTMKDSSNFFKNTKATFSLSTLPLSSPDFVSDSGSKYWYTSEGVYRSSNHWGDCATCLWFLKYVVEFEFEHAACFVLEAEYCGFARWEDFTDNRVIDWPLVKVNTIEASKKIAQEILESGKKISADRANWLHVFKENGIVTADAKRAFKAFGQYSPSQERELYLSKFGKKTIVNIF